MPENFYAARHPDTADFMEELRALFRKHGKAVVPTYEGSVSFHDPMTVVPLTPDAERFAVDETGYRT